MKTLTAVREQLRANLWRTGALVAIAVAAGMAPDAARAWGMNYESAGRTIGSELGRAAGGGAIFSPEARVASVVGEMAGQMLGRSIDSVGQQAKQAQEAERMAIEQARRDAAYEAERKRLDPTWTPGATPYSEVAQRSAASEARWGSISGNLQRNDAAMQQLVQQWEERNAPRSRGR